MQAQASKSLYFTLCVNSAHVRYTLKAELILVICLHSRLYHSLEQRL